MKLVLLLLCGVMAATAIEVSLGKPLALSEPILIERLMAAPERYVGKTVQVKGKVTEVCEMMGCWMKLVNESGQSVRIKVNDGDIVFPKSAMGRQAIAEGKLVKFDLTREQAIARAKHEAEEQGRKFDPSAIKSGSTIYQIQGAGAKILE